MGGRSLGVRGPHTPDQSYYRNTRRWVNALTAREKGLADLRLDRDLHRAAVRIRHGASPFGFFRDLGELRGLEAFEAIRGHRELRRGDRDPRIAAIGVDHRAPDRP